MPAGQVELRAFKDKLEGQATVTVTAGGTVPAEITLAEKTSETNR